MNLGVILVLVVIVILFGGGYGYAGSRYGWGGPSLISLLIGVLVIFVLLRILGVV